MEVIQESRSLECHLTWLHNILFECFSDVESGIAHVRELLNPANTYHFPYDCPWKSYSIDISYYDGLEERCHPMTPCYANEFGWKLAEAAMSVCIGNCKRGSEMLSSIRQELNGISGEHELRLRKVVLYFVEALELSIDRCRETKTTPGRNGMAQHLTKTWETLQHDAKFRAAILYCKESFRKHFPGYPENVYLENMQMVISLDPQYHVWYINAYKAMRRQRRVFTGTKEPMKAPCHQEIELCEIAYKIEVNILTTFNLAMTLKDTLWATVYSTHVDPCHVDLEETVERCLKLFNDAILLSQQHNREDWSINCSLQKAELICQISKDKEKVDKGFRLLHKLVEKYPDNAFVHQKLAMTYTYGVKVNGNKVLFRDSELAAHHLKAALALRQRNYFCCVRYYLRWFKLRKSSLAAKEALKILTECLESNQILLCERFWAEVLLWRGLIPWILGNAEKRINQIAACDDWLCILINHPELKKEVLHFVWSHRNKIPSDVLRYVLEDIGKINKGDAKTLNAVHMLLEPLQLQFLTAIPKLFAESDC